MWQLDEYVECVYACMQDWLGLRWGKLGLVLAWHRVVKRLECIKNHEEIEELFISCRIRVFTIRIRLVDFGQLITQKVNS